MPIQFTCSQCQKTLRVRDELAGRRIKCPQCQAVVRVPGLAAGEKWLMQTEIGETYGPVERSELDRWAAEGRITAESRVMLDGAKEWQEATAMYPHLAANGTSARQDAAKPEVLQESPSPRPEPTPQPADLAPAPSPAEPAPAPQPAATASSKKDVSLPLDFAPAETASTATSGPLELGIKVEGGPRGRGRTVRKKPKVKAAPSKSATAAEEEVESDEISPKSKLTTLLLAFFLGPLGVHRFYLGDAKWGLILLLTLGGCGIGAVVDFFLIALGKVNRDAHGRVLR
jgi:hypothetical protein